MRLYLHIIVSLVVFCSATAFSQTAVTLTENTRLQTAKASKAEDLYQVRLQLKKAAGKGEKTIAEMEDLAEAFRILSGGFARFSHYKNSVEAYTVYLQFTEKAYERIQAAAIDSIQKAHQNIKKTEEDEIATLSSGMGNLRERKESLSNFRSTYYLWSGISALAILLIFLVTYRNIGNKIEEKKALLASGLQDLKQLHSESVRSRMALSIPAYLSHYAAESSAALNQLSQGKTAEGTPLLGGDHKKAADTISSKLQSIG